MGALTNDDSVYVVHKQIKSITEGVFAFKCQTVTDVTAVNSVTPGLTVSPAL